MSASVVEIPSINVRESVPGPTPGTLMSPEYIRTVARLAYVWGWPMVSSFNRRVGLTSCAEPGLCR